MNESINLEAKKQRLKELANEEFPAAARAGKYPIRFNHCFLRVVYDNVFQDKWQHQLAKGKPAIHQLSAAQLDEAIVTGEAMVDDRELTVKLNEQSLRYRGKLKD
ncbi:hypothetical protein [Lewinella sp. 4G2]|uniref:hypothetical protein n=1 Tax=Lewinella sp. 4G2 TaxID=1803372 RepID=UPI0007B47767|nr:hypothetical protein [Lewinella sp. 4G2]OAV45597.1 hypothetical protein A3850_014340 [Lewinella sp. 4G2]